MRDQATVKTREIIGKLEGIRRELGLQPDQLGLVAMAYENTLACLVNDDTRARQKARHKKRRAKAAEFQKQYQAANPRHAQANVDGNYIGMFGGPVIGEPPPMPFYDLDDDDDGE